MGSSDTAPQAPDPGPAKAMDATVNSPTDAGVPDWRAWYHRHSTRFYRANRRNSWLSWIGDEPIAVGSLPTGETLPRLLEAGITHIVNCRSKTQTWLSQDLSVERKLFGRTHVVHAPMLDFGQPQHPRLWSPAATYVAQVLENDTRARVFIHCHQGRRRSVLITYAVLRLRGHDPATAADLIAQNRTEGVLVPAYASSVERWLAAGAVPVGRLR
jgi:protein-tyrosine phosphatase